MLGNDDFPFLPRDIFTVVQPLNADANPELIAYRSTVVCFAMSMNRLDDKLEAWLQKFRTFFTELPGAYEAQVRVSMTPLTDGYRDGYLNYHWKRTTFSSQSSYWSLSGDPSALADLVNPLHFTQFSAPGAFRNALIEQLKWLGEQTGQRLLVEDRLTTVRSNYDRHFTRFNRYEFTLIRFGVRTSGGMGMLEGEGIDFEFKTDQVRRVERVANRLMMELKLDMNTTRLIAISVRVGV